LGYFVGLSKEESGPGTTSRRSMRLPDEDFGDDVWVLTLDRMHCWLEEPKHPTWLQDSKYFSHKYDHAGMNYELAISLVDSKLIWMNGPFRAGANNKKCFADNGLMGQA
jgi:hypothetical protein